VRKLQCARCPVDGGKHVRCLVSAGQRKAFGSRGDHPHQRPCAARRHDLYARDLATADAHAEAADASPTTLAGFNLKIAHHHGTIPEPVEPSAEYQVATLLYTTGTTGDPKGVMLTHGNLIYGGTESARHRGITAEDHLYAVLPLTHVFGLASALMAVIAAGATTELVARFDKAATLEALKQRVSIFPAVPQLHAMLMAHAREQGLETLPTRRLKYISSGGAPLDLEWKNKVEAFFGLQMCNGYGLTETTAGIAATRPGSPRDDTSVGPPLDGSLVRIDHPNDDGIGEIAVHGPAVMKGYYRNPEETAKVLSADGWFSTGDLGFIDAAGNIHVTGRKKELIIRSGFNVYPLEVEAALNQHPDVVHAAVIGVPRDGNEEIVAFVHPATGTSLSARYVEGTPARPACALQAPDPLRVFARPARRAVRQDPQGEAGRNLRHRNQRNQGERIEQCQEKWTPVFRPALRQTNVASLAFRLPLNAAMPSCASHCPATWQSTPPRARAGLQGGGVLRLASAP
jgi:long-subunit acyl-CoA synthetase (AMP-forming)